MACKCPPGRLAHDCPAHGLKQPKPKSKGRTRIAPKSQGQSDRTHFIRGVLAAKLRAQEALPSFPFHGYQCEDCGARIGRYEDALFDFDPGHIIERTKGAPYSYSQRRTGADDPNNIKVQCPKCNRGQHEERSSPRWSTP